MSACHDPDCAVSPEADAGLPVIALAGNPNCGKTTIFNLLTGAHQHVGNWPGVTVEQRRGTALAADRSSGRLQPAGRGRRRSGRGAQLFTR